AWIAERDAALTQHRQQLVDRDQWIAERDALIQQLHQQQQAIYNSRAFRLGETLLAPLRLLRQCWRGFSHA
ncbi:MAG: hypothetical protein ACK4RS_01735, partial [Thiothrix sp.]